MPCPCRAVSRKFTHAVQRPCPARIVPCPFVKVRVLSGKIRTPNLAVWRIILCSLLLPLFYHRQHVVCWVTTIVNVRIVPGKSGTWADRPLAFERRPMSHMPFRANAVPRSEVALEAALSELGTCESNMVALCKSNGYIESFV